MGWWQIDQDGNRTDGATGAIWGDEIADIMNDAIDEIRLIYANEWDRQPSRRELEYGLKFSLADQELGTVELRLGGRAPGLYGDGQRLE